MKRVSNACMCIWLNSEAASDINGVARERTRHEVTRVHCALDVNYQRLIINVSV